MGGGGSKQGVARKLEKHKLKQCSKKKNNININTHGTVCEDACMPSRLEPNPCPETLNENSSRALNSTDSIPEESHKKTLQPKWSTDSTEYLSKRNEQDNISRELALTSSPHYIGHEYNTEDSSYGEDVRMNRLINSGDTLSPNRDSNFDINQSENYSNTLGSQDAFSSIENIICRGGDLSDSGCHFDQLTNKYFSTPPVKRVILDLSQMKYVGLSLVGGADSPFGNLPVLVKEIMPGGAAERCEIRRGDEIIGINSFSLEDKPLQFAVERLRHCSSRDQEIVLWVIEVTD